MTQLTRQEAFDKALFGIRRQGYQQSMSGSVCAYRGKNGNKCAIGHCIDDVTAQTWDVASVATDIASITDEDPEGFECYFSFSNLTFLRDLQAVHDQPDMTADTFEEGMCELADRYGLYYADPDTLPPSTVLATPYFRLGVDLGGDNV